MVLEAGLREVVRELTEIRASVEEIFATAHSVRFLFRSAVKGVDYANRAVRLAGLEEKVYRLGAVFYRDDASRGEHDVRLVQTYWCYVFLATSALVEWAEDLDREFREGSGYDRSARQLALRRYLDAIGRSRKIGRELREIDLGSL